MKIILNLSKKAKKSLLDSLNDNPSIPAYIRKVYRFLRARMDVSLNPIESMLFLKFSVTDLSRL